MPGPQGAFVSPEPLKATNSAPLSNNGLSNAHQDPNRRQYWLHLLGAAFGCFVLVYNLLPFVSRPQKANENQRPVPALAQKAPQPSASDIFNASGDDAQKLAEKFIVGTWTYSGTNYYFEEQVGYTTQKRFCWIKWVINEDGTALRYLVTPDSDNWGNPSKARWQIGTGKYSDTGKRFYQLYFDPADDKELVMDLLKERKVFIQPNGTLLYQYDGRKPNNMSHIVTMTKGDEFPFSK